MRKGWPFNAVIYQIYPRSFNDSNGDGIGDIKGIIKKIGYLKDLGVDAVWLSPIYKSPQRDFGYDIDDHKAIDPIFGNMADFDELVLRLHENNIKIIMDFVPNHTSSSHPWFIESRSNKTNPKRDWYVWRDPKPNGEPPNNWMSAFGGSAWKLDKETNQYFYHAFDEHQPDLNWNNPEVKKEMFGVMRFWLDKGVDGFRTDAVDYLFEDKGFKDEPINPNYRPGFHQYTDQELLHIYTNGQKESIDLLREMANILREYEDKFMVTEAATTLSELIKMYKAVDWHSYHPFNFSLINLPWLAAHHKEYIDEYEKRLGPHYLPCYVTGNHDQPRVVTRVGKKQARNAALLLLTLRGNAFIYNGEEIGMRNRKIPKDKSNDTYDLSSPGLGLGRNGQRTPMQWNDTNNAGFSTNEPWLPVSLNYGKVNAESENNDPKSFLNLYKKLIRLKKNNLALSNGDYVPLKITVRNVFCFFREYQDKKIFVAVNFGSKARNLNIVNKKGKVLVNSFLNRKDGELVDLSRLYLKADEGIVIELI
ncbi:MAG TPA: alpha-amylase family glycosyl hydrolase [Patescibacteria group bacterium]|nr:alpha-amylase family glycosyl hydrolase [Patescibacteria group bacterium]